MSVALQSYKRFRKDCRDCPRLACFLDEVRAAHPGYHSAPVAPFGDPCARLLIVGLAPGMHGANRTGRPFTGDYAGILLYQTLQRHGFASAPQPMQVSATTFGSLAAGSAVLALGTVAHRAVLLAQGLRAADYRFAHGAVHRLPSGLALFDSYHCSRYNTQTYRLTGEMFEAVFASISLHLKRS